MPCPPPLPPTLPTAALKRVTGIAKIDGISIVIVATLGAIAAALLGDVAGLLIGSLILCTGALELLGVRMLKRGKVVGLKMMIGSQLMLLGLIWIYVGVRLWTGTDAVLQKIMTPELIGQIARMGVDTRLLVELMHKLLPLTYGVVALATLIYQGGLAWFFWSQKNALYKAEG